MMFRESGLYDHLPPGNGAKPGKQGEDFLGGAEIQTVEGPVNGKHTRQIEFNVFLPGNGGGGDHYPAAPGKITGRGVIPAAYSRPRENTRYFTLYLLRSAAGITDIILSAGRAETRRNGPEHASGTAQQVFLIIVNEMSITPGALHFMPAGRTESER